MKDVASDLVDVLKGQTLGGVLLARGTNLFVGLMPEDDDSITNDNCVAIVETGGPPPNRFLGNASRVMNPTAQVLVRGKASNADPQAAKDFARAVFAALELPDVAGYLWVKVRESSPFPVPADSGMRPRWVFNVEAAYEAT